MSRRLTLPGLAAAALLVGGGCYQDDTTTSFASDRKPLARVLLTDAPFPYDSVTSVNIYVVRIEADIDPDTSGGGEWVRIAEPRKSFNLLELQQGTTAFVGEGELPAGKYRAIRVTIDTSLSSIVWSGGAKAPVNWQNSSGSNEMSLYALVEYPVDVPTGGAEVVIDFDVGRSFLYDFYGTKEFTLVPQLRAINSAATGRITGTVTTPSIEGAQPVRNANITLCGGGSCDPTRGGYVVATGRSDAAGHYTVAFVRAGSYAIRFEQPDMPFLVPVEAANVQVTAGGTTTRSPSLPPAGGGGAYIRISGPTSVGVGGRVILLAAVGDANGNPVSNPPVSWTTSDPAVAELGGVPDSAGVWVTGRQAGVATISATSGGLTDSHEVQVVVLGPVATVTVLPESATIAVADTFLPLEAVVRDAEGHVLNRGAFWFTPDSSVLDLLPCGECSGDGVRGRAPGVGTVYATRDGKTGQATITVR